MKKIYEDLYQTKVFTSGHLKTHAYYLKTNHRNVLIYNTNNKEDIDEIDKKGTLNLQCLSHRHEITNSLTLLKNRFNHVLYLDEQEARELIKTTNIDVNTNIKQVEGEGLKLFLTPGHTSGGTTFYYESKVSNLNYLFTGDTYFLWDGKLSTLVLKNEGGSKQQLIKSLEFCKTLSPDVIIPSASLGGISYLEVTKKQWLEFLDESIKSLY